MERLTARTEKGLAYLVNVKPDEQVVESPYKNTLQCILDCFDRLAAYEDTGLTPEEVIACKHALMGRGIAKITEFEGISLDRLEEICNAERDGRCYTPPVKIGDTVYWRSRFGNAIHQGKVYEIKISSFGFDLELRTAENQRFLRESEKCYFTRKAAEAALKERE